MIHDKSKQELFYRTKREILGFSKDDTVQTLLLVVRVYPHFHNSAFRAFSHANTYDNAMVKDPSFDLVTLRFENETISLMMVKNSPLFGHPMPCRNLIPFPKQGFSQHIHV